MSTGRGRPARVRRNPLIEAGIEHVDDKDTALRRFSPDRGKIRARRVTGLIVQQQREVTRAIRNAREMARLPYPVSGPRAGRAARTTSEHTVDARITPSIPRGTSMRTGDDR